MTTQAEVNLSKLLSLLDISAEIQTGGQAELARVSAIAIRQLATSRDAAWAANVSVTRELLLLEDENLELQAELLAAAARWDV